MSSGSRSPWRSGRSLLRLSFVVTLLISSLFATAMHTHVAAQDATPAGDACAPIGGDEAAATPEAASPVVEEAPVGTPVEDQATIDAATAVVTEAWDCVNEFGLTSTFSSVLTVFDYGDGTLGVDYQIATGTKQVERYLDVLVEDAGAWSISERTALAPETDLDKVSVGVKLVSADGTPAIEIAVASFEASPATLFQITNDNDVAQAFALLTVPEGFDPAAAGSFDVLAIPEGTTLEGVTILDAGASGVALFEGLTPGNYAAYSLAVAEDGATLTDQGLSTVLTVTEPVELDIPDVVGTPAD